MDLSKRYNDAFALNKKVDILHMVRNYPEWAANRIQVGERALAMLSEKQRKIAETGSISARQDTPDPSPSPCHQCGGNEFHREISQCRDYLICKKCGSVRNYAEAFEPLSSDQGLFKLIKKTIECHFCSKRTEWERPSNPLVYAPLPKGWIRLSPALGGWFCCETCNGLLKLYEETSNNVQST